MRTERDEGTDGWRCRTPGFPLTASNDYPPSPLLVVFVREEEHSADVSVSSPRNVSLDAPLSNTFLDVPLRDKVHDARFRNPHPRSLILEAASLTYLFLH